nr:hypothetical protein [Tanacetum cinerariifolium]
MDHSLGSAEEVDHVRILQSCNGLLLCTGSAWPVCYYVYNPSTNLFKRLPQPNYSHDDSCFYSSGVFRMAFDPRKSLYYKVLQARRASGETQIQIYSSETRNWSLCRDRDDIGSTEFTIYEMMKGSFVWSVRSNQTDDDDDVEFISPFSVDPNLYEFIPSLASV